jgi:phosphohistidine phosphatase
MKEVLLLRHAKSDWGADSRTDHDRPLAPRGIRAAETIGAFLERTGMVPDVAVTSSAVRAGKTLELVVAQFRRGRLPPRQVAPELYESSPGRALEVIQGLPEETLRVLLVGHNPTWESVLSMLLGGGRFRLPTGALALIRFECTNWRDVAPGEGTLRWLVTPKILGAVGAS